MIRRLILFLIVAALPFLTGCEGLKRLTDGATSTPPAAAGASADYTVSGTTIEDFETVDVRVVDSDLTIKVKRPNEDWTVLDQFEVYLIKSGVGGGAVRFGYRNLYVNGMTRPVAPKGTQFEIRSVLRS